MPAEPTLQTTDRAEQLVEDRRTYGLHEISFARTSLIRAMSFLDMPQTRGAHVEIAQAIDLLDSAKSEAKR